VVDNRGGAAAGMILGETVDIMGNDRRGGEDRGGRGDEGGEGSGASREDVRKQRGGVGAETKRGRGPGGGQGRHPPEGRGGVERES
jgi:hypothetical protein